MKLYHVPVIYVRMYVYIFGLTNNKIYTKIISFSDNDCNQQNATFYLYFKFKTKF